MKRLVLVLILIAAAFLVWLLLQRQPQPAPVAIPKSQPTQDTAVANALSNASPAAEAAIENSFTGVTTTQAAVSSATPSMVSTPAGKAFAPEVTSLSPMSVVENVRTAIHNYGQRFGGNPVGNNAEITRVLGGENPGQVNYLNADAGLRVNEKGEMIDAWGTPFFFHQLSGTVMEIHSAGPDKILWTEDDLVTQ